MTELIYIIKTIAISGFLFGYYLLFLRNRAFHGFNRLFLLSIPVISFLLPAFHFSIPVFWNHRSGASPIPLLGVAQGNFEEAFTIYANHKSVNIITWRFMAGLLSLLVSTFLFIRFFITIRFLYLLPKGKSFLNLPEATLYFVSEKGTPFSFFKSIFWGEEMEINSSIGKQILRHEIYHVVNKHSLDILLLEISSICLWFNPFIHFIRREIRAIHEYAADAYAAAETNRYAYARLLIMSSNGKTVSLTHPFFKNHIKRRITMMTKSKNKKNLLGRFMILPLIAVLICIFSFKMQNHFNPMNSKSIRVVIDAGHGGLDPGSTTNGIPEKNINLGIARKIQELAPSYSIEVIMTREKDELPGKSQNIADGLKYRADLAGKENASLFISIDTNTTPENKPQETYSGFDIYVPGNESSLHENSVKLGSIIAENIKPDYTIAPELKERNSGIMILNKATVPAILIECGYMDNRSDMAYMTDEKNQEKIARDILEGIKKYASLEISYIQASEYQISDTVSYEEMSKMNSAEIISVHMNSENNTTTLGLKNGRHIIVKWTEEMIEKYGALFFPNVISQDSSGILTKVEQEAEYPGGQSAWYAYLAKNLKYPENAIAKEIQGTVDVEFIVKTDGTLKDVHAKNGPDALRAESVRVLKASGKWTPAKNKGVKVNSYHIQPLNYRLEPMK